MPWQAKENEGEGEREEAIYIININAYRFSATYSHRLKMQSNKTIICKKRIDAFAVMTNTNTKYY